MTALPALLSKPTPATQLLLASICLLLASCTNVTSLHPLAENANDRVFQKALEGTWKQTGEVANTGEYLQVMLQDDSLYHIQLVMRSPGNDNIIDTSYFTGQLVSTEGHLFLDCTIDASHPSLKKVGQYSLMTLLPGHVFCRLAFHSDPRQVDLWIMQGDKDNHLGEWLEQKKEPFYSFMFDVVLLAPSARLKKLVVELVREYPDLWRKRTLVRSEDRSNTARALPVLR